MFVTYQWPRDWSVLYSPSLSVCIQTGHQYAGGNERELHTVTYYSVSFCFGQSYMELWSAGSLRSCVCSSRWSAERMKCVVSECGGGASCWTLIRTTTWTRSTTNSEGVDVWGWGCGCGERDCETTYEQRMTFWTKKHGNESHLWLLPSSKDEPEVKNPLLGLPELEDIFFVTAVTAPAVSGADLLLVGGPDSEWNSYNSCWLLNTC